MERGKVLRRLLPLFIAVIVIAAAAGIASRTVDRQEIRSDTGQQTTAAPLPEEETVDVGGVACTPKKNIRTYLFMGLDAQGETETVDEYVSTGQCDTLQLLVIDETDNTYTRLPLNRDTMTDVNSLDYDGTCLATSRLQLALAHASGDGGAISCENTVDAVSGLLSRDSRRRQVREKEGGCRWQSRRTAGQHSCRKKKDWKSAMRDTAGSSGILRSCPTPL